MISISYFYQLQLEIVLDVSQKEVKLERKKSFFDLRAIFINFFSSINMNNYIKLWKYLKLSLYFADNNLQRRK